LNSILPILFILSEILFKYFTTEDTEITERSSVKTSVLYALPPCSLWWTCFQSRRMGDKHVEYSEVNPRFSSSFIL